MKAAKRQGRVLQRRELYKKESSGELQRSHLNIHLRTDQHICMRKLLKGKGKRDPQGLERMVPIFPITRVENLILHGVVQYMQGLASVVGLATSLTA